MSIVDNDPQVSRARQPLVDLRRTLQGAKTTDDAERIHAALVDVVDGLITYAERQVRAIDDLRSDLSHKQGLVTNIGGGDFVRSSTSGRLREFASSSNGDLWCLERDGANGIVHVVYKANPSSGGAVTRIGLGEFLSRRSDTPEVLALSKLIGSLLD